MAYEIAGKQFSSKQAITKHVREILRKTEAGRVLLEDDKSFVLGLIELHPRSREKTGVGIKHIIARVDPVWKKGKQFLIIRIDGSTVDFSYKKCVYGEMSKMDFFRSACRTAVVKDIVAFKMKHLLKDTVCPYYGTLLTRENSHVDHVKPRTFNWIVGEFILRSGLDVPSVEINGDTQKRFDNPLTSEQFRQFHNEVAILELVSERANQTCCKVSWKGTLPQTGNAGGANDYQEHAAANRRQQG